MLSRAPEYLLHFFDSFVLNFVDIVGKKTPYPVVSHNISPLIFSIRQVDVRHCTTDIITVLSVHCVISTIQYCVISAVLSSLCTCLQYCTLEHYVMSAVILSYRIFHFSSRYILSLYLQLVSYFFRLANRTGPCDGIQTLLFLTIQLYVAYLN